MTRKKNALIVEGANEEGKSQPAGEGSKKRRQSKSIDEVADEEGMKTCMKKSLKKSTARSAEPKARKSTKRMQSQLLGSGADEQVKRLRQPAQTANPRGTEMRRWRCELDLEDFCRKIVKVLDQSAGDPIVQLEGINQLAEVACTPDVGSVWRAGGVGPCVRAMQEFSHVTEIQCKASTVLQCAASESVEAARDVLHTAAVPALLGAIRSWPEDRSKAFDLHWRVLAALHELCAADEDVGTDALLQATGESDDLRSLLLLIQASFEHDSRSTLIAEHVEWLIAHLLESSSDPTAIATTNRLTPRPGQWHREDPNLWLDYWFKDS